MVKPSEKIDCDNQAEVWRPPGAQGVKTEASKFHDEATSHFKSSSLAKLRTVPREICHEERLVRRNFISSTLDFIKFKLLKEKSKGIKNRKVLEQLVCESFYARSLSAVSVLADCTFWKRANVNNWSARDILEPVLADLVLGAGSRYSNVSL